MDTYEYKCSLVRVTDADTMVVNIDLGFRLTATMPIRLHGINAPELKTQAGKEARAWTIEWFNEHPRLTVITYKDPEKYGRWLGVIRALPDNVSLNDALVDAGHAKAWDGTGVRPTHSSVS